MNKSRLSFEEIEQLSWAEDKWLLKFDASVYENEALSRDIIDSDNEESIIWQMRFRQIKAVIDKLQWGIAFINDYIKLSQDERLSPEEILNIDSDFQVNILKDFIKLLETLFFTTSINDKYALLNNKNRNLKSKEKLIRDIFLILINNLNQDNKNTKESSFYIRNHSVYIVNRLANIFFDILILNKVNIDVAKTLEEMWLSQVDEEAIVIEHETDISEDTTNNINEWLKSVQEEEKQLNESEKKEALKNKLNAINREICKYFYNKRLKVDTNTNILDSILLNTEWLDPNLKRSLMSILNNTYKNLSDFFMIYLSKTDYYKWRNVLEWVIRKRVYYIDYVYIKEIEFKKWILRAYAKQKLTDFISNKSNPIIRDYIEKFWLFDLLLDTVLKTLFDELNKNEIEKEIKTPIPDSITDKYKEYATKKRKSYW